jgi:subtilisin family serine protease
MRRMPFLALLVLVTSQLAVPSAAPRAGFPVPAVPAQESSAQYYVAFKGGMPSDLASRVAALGGSVVDVVADLKVAIVGNLTPDAAAALAKQADVADMAEDPLVVPDGPAKRTAYRGSVPAPVPNSTTHPELAGAFPYQWNLRVIGADLAWQAGELGSPSVRVAMIDSGIDPTHPDLAGLVDASRSTSFCPAETAAVAAEFPGYPAWTDLAGHGTWTASIVSSNAHLAAGVTSRTTLMSVKALGLLPCPSSALFRAIYYATDAGADVLNLSLGVPVGVSKRGRQGFFRFYKYAAQYALVKGASAVVVAAGNSGLDLDHNGDDFTILCDVPGVICVSATGPTDSGPQLLGPFVNIDAPAFYTNYGSAAINVAAPGGNGVLDANGNLVSAGWVWGACASTDREIVAGVLVPGFCSSAGYTLLGSLGTSASAPHVSALAALLVNRYGHQQKGQVQSAIQNSADDRGKPGQDPFYGRGRINVARALGIK